MTGRWMTPPRRASWHVTLRHLGLTARQMEAIGRRAGINATISAWDEATCQRMLDLAHETARSLT